MTRPSTRSLTTSVRLLAGLGLTTSLLAATTALGLAPSSASPCDASANAHQAAAEAECFDALNATEAELRARDFPEKPTDPAMLKTWTAYAKSYRDGETTFMSPCMDEIGGSSAADPQTGAASNNVWAGNQVLSHHYTDVYSTWVVPDATRGGVTQAAQSSMWVGLGTGASASRPLVQAGSESQADGDEYVWYEVYPHEAEISIPAFGTNMANHQLFVHVTHDPDHGRVTYHLVDQTRPFDFRLTRSIAPTPREGVAEAIVERPEHNGRHTALANFGSFRFTGTKAYSGATGWQPLGALPHQYYVMQQNGRTLAWPDPFDSTNTAFSVRWLAGGVEGP